MHTDLITGIRIITVHVTLFFNVIAFLLTELSTCYLIFIYNSMKRH